MVLKMENLEKSNISFDDNLSIVNIHSTNWHILNRQWDYPRTLSNRAQLYIVIEGEYNAFINDKKFRVCENDILYVPADYVYTSSGISERFSFIAVYFDVASHPDQPNKGFFTKPFKMQANEEIKQKFINLYEEISLKNVGYLITSKAILYDILKICLINSWKSEIPEGYYLIKKAISYIRDNYTQENIDVNYLAELCGITPTYFINVFKNIYKKTPKKYLVEMRIEKAKELLIYSRYSVSEIAEKLGYSDNTYFSNAFKSFTGTSPLNFRKNK